MDNDDLKMAAWIGLLLVSLLVVSVLAISVMSIPFEVGQCKTLKQIDTSHKYQWVLWGGCLVETSDGYWIDPDNIKHNDVNLH